MLLKHFKKTQQTDEPKEVAGSSTDFTHLLDSLTTSIMLVDADLRLLYLNSACESLFEVSMSHMQGIMIDAIFHESVSALDKIKQSLADENQYTKRKVLWRLHNQNSLTVDYTVIPLVDKGMILFEIQPLDRLLQISREEAMIASQGTTRNLVRGLAHEVKNPLGGIRGAAQLLDKELEHLDAGVGGLQEYTQIIIDEADRLRNLVDRMLGPRQVSQFTPLNIHEALERVLTIIHVETHGSIELVRNYDPSIPAISADLELLIQALLNIVRNAVQAITEQEENSAPIIKIQTRIKRQFTIGRQHHPLVCCISIIDNGPGIPEELMKDIFYPMISGRAEGTGLGLAISQQLIHQHRGLIECESEPGMTEFSIYIPLDAT